MEIFSPLMIRPHPNALLQRIRPHPKPLLQRSKDIELKKKKNKAGYTATFIACGWAGAMGQLCRGIFRHLGRTGIQDRTGRDRTG